VTKQDSLTNISISKPLTPDQKYNFASCLTDSAGWTFGMAFFSTATIVPAFLSKLGAGNILIGVLPALITLGYNAPGIFVAAHISRMSRARPWLFPTAIMERIPLLLMGLAAMFVRSHSELLWMFLALFAVHAVLLGLNQPAYWVVVGKSVPKLWRGRLFGFAGLVGGICSFAVLPITRRFLITSGHELIRGFASCFIVGSIIEFISVMPLAFVREPDTVDGEDAPYATLNRAFLRDIWGTSPGFRRFILGQALFSVWLIAAPFYLLDGIKRLHVGGAEIGLYTAIAAVVAAFGSSLCGLLSDRRGNRLVLLITGACGCAASLYALVVGSPSLLTVVFALSAFAGAGAGIAGYNITLEYAPTFRQISHYTAFYNLTMAPIRAIALIAGGVISQSFNFAPLFWISAIAAALSVALTWTIKEPRHSKAAEIIIDPVDEETECTV
jgi:MFS family permease